VLTSRCESSALVSGEIERRPRKRQRQCSPVHFARLRSHCSQGRLSLDHDVLRCTKVDHIRQGDQIAFSGLRLFRKCSTSSTLRRCATAVYLALVTKIVATSGEKQRGFGCTPKWTEFANALVICREICRIEDRKRSELRLWVLE
jgi:hypothetical protein